MNSSPANSLSWSTWYKALSQLAKAHNISVADQDAWKEPWEQCRTPAVAFFDEYPEYGQTARTNAEKTCASAGEAQHSTPCRECPWKRKSAPGWLGASEPGEFLALADSPAKMPCHLRVDYEDKDWKAQAAAAPQCAGRAIFQANRCKAPKNDQLTLPADRELVFTWPHEFVAHHARIEPSPLEGKMAVDLYGIRRATTSAKA